MGAVKTSRGCHVLYFTIALLSTFAPPKGGHAQTVAGFTPSSFQVSGTGSATSAIPIRVPPGIAGIEPKLFLTYNNGQTDNGLMGIGWSLAGLSTISRCPRTLSQDGVRGAVNYDANDRFCLDGQRLIMISGTSYGADGAEYRTERDSFTKVISNGVAGNGPAWFKAWTKSGQIVEYGNTTDSRIEAQGKTTARLWAVNKVSDLKGNYLTVTYSEDGINGDYFPTRIDYTGNASVPQAPLQAVTFGYVGRTDQTPNYQAGSLSRTMNLLNRVTTFVSGVEVAEYRLAYQTSPATGRSSLQSVTECSAPTGPCLPQVAFGWQADVTGIGSWNWQTLNIGSANENQHFFADVNGDGKADWIQVSAVSNNAWVGLSNGDGSFTTWTWQSANVGSASNYQHFFADVNGDGKADWIQVTRTFASNDASVGLSNGDGSFTWTWHSGTIKSATMAQHFFADVNGDGKADWIQVDQSLNNAAVGLSNGDGSFTTWTWQSVIMGSMDNYQHFFADVNGDGKADWIRVARTTSEGSVALSNGDGSFTPWTWQSTNIGAMANFQPFFADVNGDGKADWIQVARSTNDGWVGLSNGDGSFATWTWHTPNVTSMTAAQHFFDDINGDGKVDWIQVAQSTSDAKIGFSNGDGSFATWTWQSTAMGALDTYQPFFADVNGDGKTDWIRVARASPDARVVLASGGAPDLLTSMTTSLGASTTATYKPITDTTVYTKEASATPPAVDFQAPLYVVSAASTSNGVGGNIVTNYAYGGLKMELGTGRSSLGFRWMEATDAQTGIKLRSESRQDWPYIGLPSFAKKSQASGDVLSQKTNTYSCINPANGAACTIAAGNRYFPFLLQSVEAGNDLIGTGVPTVTTTAPQYDTYGNAISVAVSTTDGYSKTTTNTFTNDATNWILGRLTRASVQSTSPDVPPTSPAPPSVSASPSPLTISAPTAENAAGSVTASAAGGVPPFTYAWSRLTGSRIAFSGTQTATFSTSVGYGDNFTESFRVTATDSGGGTATSDVNVTAIGPGTPPAPTITTTPATPLSNFVTGGATVNRSITANVTGLPPFTYSWSIVSTAGGSWAITSPQSQTTTLSGSVLACDWDNATFRVTVTDAVSRSVSTDVNWTIRSQAAPNTQCP